MVMASSLECVLDVVIEWVISMSSLNTFSMINPAATFSDVVWATVLLKPTFKVKVCFPITVVAFWRVATGLNTPLVMDIVQGTKRY